MAENLYISFLVEPEMARELKIASAVRGMSRSEFIRETMREKLEERPIEVRIGERVREPANA